MALTSLQKINDYAGNTELLGDKHPNVADVLEELQGYVTKTVRKAVASNYSATVEDVYIGVTSTAADRTVTLPAAAACGNGKVFIIKDESGAANTDNITVDANAAETIDGAATKVISTAYGSTRLICNGSNWFTC